MPTSAGRGQLDSHFQKSEIAMKLILTAALFASCVFLIETSIATAQTVPLDTSDLFFQTSTGSAETEASFPPGPQGPGNAGLPKGGGPIIPPIGHCVIASGLCRPFVK